MKEWLLGLVKEVVHEILIGELTRHGVIAPSAPPAPPR